MNLKLKKSIKNMVENFNLILKGNIKSVYVYGSIVLNDFKLGWSDIDILVLTKKSLDEQTAKSLLSLRQEMLKKRT